LWPPIPTLLPYTSLFRSEHILHIVGSGKLGFYGLRFQLIVNVPFYFQQWVGGNQLSPYLVTRGEAVRNGAAHVPERCHLFQECIDRKSTRLNSSHVKISY